MALRSSIEWTQSTWNPVTGCSKVSPGCLHCYAERLSYRLKRMGNARYASGFRVTLHDDLLQLPSRWREPRLVFVNSMSDLFHEAIPFEFIQSVFSTIQATPWHTFQVLTKRATRLAEVAAKLPWPDNLWIGVSVEKQDYVWRADCLRSLPTLVRFISCEPLLGSIKLPLQDIRWVIAGGESGPEARQMDLDWARSLRDQCLAAGVPFFLKQLGGAVDKRGREQAILDGRLWREMPRNHSR